MSTQNDDTTIPESLEDRLDKESSDLLYVPPNPIEHLSKELTKDELIAAGTSAAITTAVAYALYQFTDLPPAYTAPLLAFVATQAENPGLFYRSTIKTHKHWKGLPKEQQTRMNWLRIWWNNSKSTLVADQFHDLFHAGLTWAGLQAMGIDEGYQAGLVTTATFFTAIPPAAFIEVQRAKLGHKMFQNGLLKRGMEKERMYTEMRYLVSPTNEIDTAQNLPRALAQHFNLPEVSERELFYEDTIISDHLLPAFHGWEPTVRYRSREKEVGEGLNRTYQLVWTRNKSIRSKDLAAVNCFAEDKLKFYLRLCPELETLADPNTDPGRPAHDLCGYSPMPTCAAEIPQEAMRKFAMKKVEGQHAIGHYLRWRRGYARDQNGLLFTVDRPEEEYVKRVIAERMGVGSFLHDGEPTGEPFILEVKYFGDARMLLEVNRKILYALRALPTTESKAVLAGIIERERE